MYRFALALGVSAFILTSCGTAPRSDREIVRDRGLDAGSIIVGPTTEGHVYAEFGPGADRFPPPRVLFFSGKDPFSDDIQQALLQIYGSGGVTASTFRINFATGTGSRLQYRVLLPGSVVVITHSGATTPLVHPSSDDLRRILLPPIPSLT
ncbi:MAG: hypothetical protein ABL890_01595 [Candidatus Peribacteraceae bacterium]